MQDLIRQLLAELGEDPSREGLRDTPKRVEKAYRFLTSGYDADIDRVLNNPPFHENHAIGDATAWQMFTESRDVLRPGGELWVVGNRHLAYHAKLKRLFGTCDVIANNDRFVILRARRSA